MRKRRTSTKKYLLKLLFGLFVFFAVAGGLFVWLSPTPEQKVAKYIAHGQQFLKEDNTGKAKIEFKNALQIDRRNGLALYGMGEAFEQEGEPRKAYELYLAAAQQDQHLVKAQIKLAQIYLLSGNADKLEETLRSLQQLAPDQADVLALKANVKLRQAQSDEAVTLAKTALEKDPLLAEAMMVLATERVLAKDYPAALQLLDDGLKKRPDYVIFYLAKVEALEKSGQTEKTEAALQALVKQYPNKPNYKKMLIQTYLQHRQPEKAEQALRTLIASDETDHKAKVLLVALVNKTRGKLAARAEFDRMLKETPKDTQLQFARYEFELQQSEPAVATGILQHIIKTADKTEDKHKAMVMLANELVHQHHEPQAQELLESVLNADSKNTTALMTRASINAIAGRDEMAIADYRTVLGQHPNDVKVRMALANIYEKAGLSELANMQYVESLNIVNNKPDVALAYSAYLLRNGQTEKAASTLEALIKHFPNTPQALVMLAQLNIRQGNWSAASRQAEALKQQPGSLWLAWQIQGNIASAQKNFIQASSAYEQAYQHQPDNEGILKSLVFSMQAAGKSNESEQLLKKLIAENKQGFSARLLLAELYTKTHPAKVEPALRDLIATFPKHQAGYIGLFKWYMQQHQAGLAKQALLDGVQAATELQTLQFLLANTLQQEGKHEEAINIYETQLVQHPNNLLMRNNLVAMLLDYHSDQASVERAYQLSLPLKQSVHPEIRDTAGWAAYKAGRYQEAVKLCQYATEKKPQSGIFQYHMAKAYLGILDKRNGKKALEAALKYHDEKQGYSLEEVKKLLAA